MNIFMLLLVAAPGEVPRAARPLGACHDLVQGSSVAAAGFGQILGGFERIGGEAADFNEFRLERGDLGACVQHPRAAGAVLQLEAIRSAGRDSLFGIDGDSIVVRLRHAYAHYRPKLGPGTLHFQLGLIPEPWVQNLDFRYDLRGLAPTLAERGGFFEASDLGGAVGYQWGRSLGATVALTNGEGRNQVELNSGKNITAVVFGTPLVIDGPGGPWAIGAQLGWRDGSLGVGRARNHRWAAALGLVHPRLRAGAEFYWASGYLGRGELTAAGYAAWLSGTVWAPYLGLVARIDRLDPDRSLDDSAAQWLTLGVYADIIDQDDRAPLRARVHLVAQKNDLGSAAPPLAGAGAAVEAFRVGLWVEFLAFWAEESI